MPLSTIDMKQIPDGVQRVTTVAILRGIAPSTGRAIDLLGYYANGDGGGGPFYGVTGAAPGTYVDNGGTIIVPTGGDGSSAWLRVFDSPVHASWFGTKGDGSSGDYSIIHNLVSLSYIKSIIFDPGNYLISGDLEFPESISIIAVGAKFTIQSGCTLTVKGQVLSTNGYPFNAPTGGNVVIGINVADKAIYSSVSEVEALTRQNMTSPDIGLDWGTYGYNPHSAGLNFVSALDTGVRQIYSAIQCEVFDRGALPKGRLHFLVLDNGNLQPVLTIDNHGAAIVGPGSPAYLANIAGMQVIPYFTGNLLSPVFGERLSAADPDQANPIPIALRNTFTGNIYDSVAGAPISPSSPTYNNDTVSIGFSILNSAGYENEMCVISGKYSDRTAGAESSQFRFQTKKSGAVEYGPYIYNGGIGFDSSVSENNKLDAYETGTWTPSFGGSTGGTLAATWTNAPSGHYVRIGKLLFVSFYAYAASASSYPTGLPTVSGLPFASAANANSDFMRIHASAATAGGTNPSSYTAGWSPTSSYAMTLYSGNSWGASGAVELGGAGVLLLA